MFPTVMASLLILVGNQPHEHTLEDLLKYKCNYGNQEACQRLKDIEHDKEDAERLQQRVFDFGKELEQMDLMLDEKRPDLRAAYPLVMGDYFAALHESGSTEEILSPPKLQQCASHYHEYWLNKKLWWPNEDGQPDWEDIYVFIVDHYYGFCIKQM